MNKTILIGIGAVAAYLLYKKFNATEKVGEGEVAEEQPEEQAEEGGGGAPSGGGGGGGSAPTPKPTDKPSLMKSGQVPTKQPMGKPLVRLSRPNVRLGKPRPMASKPMRPIQGMSRPMARPMARPLVATKPAPKFAGFMDFDGFPDVQANIM